MLYTVYMLHCYRVMHQASWSIYMYIGGPFITLIQLHEGNDVIDVGANNVV